MVHVKPVYVIASDHVHQTITGPLVDQSAARTQTDAPLLVPHVEGPAKDVPHGVFWIDITTVAPQTECPHTSMPASRHASMTRSNGVSSKPPTVPATGG